VREWDVNTNGLPDDLSKRVWNAVAATGAPVMPNNQPVEA
jgi:hypothetical protein